MDWGVCDIGSVIVCDIKVSILESIDSVASGTISLLLAFKVLLNAVIFSSNTFNLSSSLDIAEPAVSDDF